MKVSSPVGEFPFDPDRIDLEDGGIVIRGSMGAWPAHVRIEPADVPPLLRAVPLPLWLGALAAVILAWRILTRR